MSTVQLFSTIIHRPGRRSLPPWSQHQRRNVPPPLPIPVECNKDDNFMLCLLVHLSCVQWSVLHLSFVVCHKEWCTWIALSIPLNTAYLLQYQLQTRCNNGGRTARRLWNVLSSFLFYLTTFQRQRLYREKWQHVSDWRTYEGKQSSLVFVFIIIMFLKG